MSVATEQMDGLLAGQAVPDVAAPQVQDLLAQLGQDDPRMAALCKFFVQRQADAAQAAVDTAPPDSHANDRDANDPDALSQLEARHTRLRGIAGDMQRELRVLRDRNAIAAAALGACETCWGHDRACPHCDGRGRPGFDAPDPPLYARLVAPALRRMMRQHDPHHTRAPVSAPLPNRAADGPAAGPLD